MNNGPYDLYKIITETFETLTRCNHHEVAKKLIKISQEEIYFYEHSLGAIIVKELYDVYLIFYRKN